MITKVIAVEKILEQTLLYDFYGELLTGNTFGENKHFTKAYIPLNSRSGLKNPDLPTAPHKMFDLNLYDFLMEIILQSIF